MPKQVAASRQLSQRGISELDRGDWDAGEKSLARSIELCAVDPESRRHYAEALWIASRQWPKRRGTRPRRKKSGPSSWPKCRRPCGFPARTLGWRSGRAKCCWKWAAPPRLAAWPTKPQASIRGSARPGCCAGKSPRPKGGWTTPLAQLQRALQYQHDDKRALLFTAELYRQLGRPEPALNTLETLRDGYAPGEEPQRVLYLQGLAFSALGRYRRRGGDVHRGLADAIGPPRSFTTGWPRRIFWPGERARRPTRSPKRCALEPNRGPSRELATRIESGPAVAAGDTAGVSRPVVPVFPIAMARPGTPGEPGG